MQGVNETTCEYPIVSCITALPPGGRGGMAKRDFVDSVVLELSTCRTTLPPLYAST